MFTTNTTTPTGIARAVAAAGGQEALARNLGVTQQTVSYWVRRGYPAEIYVRAIARIGRVPPASLVRRDLVKAIVEGLAA
jgi:DNA-binding transcriptional regulator YdaS (Cro superfamily)